VSLSTRVLLALIAGTVAGLALRYFDAGAAAAAVAVFEPIGTLFVNAIRVTVVPLVVSSLIVGIATSQSGVAVARLGGRGIIVFLLLLLASGLMGAFVSTPILMRVAPDPNTVAAMRAHAGSIAGGIASGGGGVQSTSDWIVSLVPSNAVRAAVDGAMLPLIIFALLLGLALISVPESSRTRVVVFFRAIAESMLVLVRWLLVVAPIGVFALALPLVARLGLSAVGALVTYVGLVSLVAMLFMLLVLYPAGAWGGRISLREFARAVAPAQAVAFSSRSSLAALPALIESSRDRLHLPPEITGFFLPLAASVFRVGAALGLTTGAVFIARLYGVSITTAQLATIVATAIITSFSIPGIPGGSIIAMAPVLASVGLPLEGIGILLGVDAIPDLFRTTANATGHLTAALIVSRGVVHPAPTAATAIPET
jgi:proton glutamate symport protein